MDENIVLEEQTAITGVNRASLSKAIEAIKAKEAQFKKPFDMTIGRPVVVDLPMRPRPDALF